MPNTAATYALRPDPALRYRLDVVALDVAGLVAAAGGWLYHRVATGWDVTVAVPGRQNRGPLQILGVRTVDLEAELATAPRRPAAQCLAVGAEAAVTDARIRERVARALRCGRTEVVVWGDRWPLNHRLDPMRHVPTVAGAAFKRQSLLAAGARADDGPAPPELFYSDQRRCPAVVSDLVPVD